MGHIDANVTVDISYKLMKGSVEVHTQQYDLYNLRTTYRFSDDGLLCIILFVDINECLNDNAGCDHECMNTNGSYYCECNSGFQLSSDNHTCEGNYQHTVLCIVQLYRMIPGALGKEIGCMCDS